MRYLNCFFVNIAWIMLSNILYVSSMHIKVDTPLQSPIWISCGPFVPGWVVGFSIIVSSRSSGFNLWISDFIFDNEKLEKNYYHQDYLWYGYFVACKLVILLHFHRDYLPYKKHTLERYNYSSKHGNELVASDVPQVLQQLCDVDQHFSVGQQLHHLYPSFHIYWLENFLDDECCDLFFFISDHQSAFRCCHAEAAVSLWLLQYPFVIKLDKTQKCWCSLTVADFFFHSLIREQNPFIDLLKKGEDFSN